MEIILEVPLFALDYFKRSRHCFACDHFNKGVDNDEVGSSLPFFVF